MVMVDFSPELVQQVAVAVLKLALNVAQGLGPLAALS